MVNSKMIEELKPCPEMVEKVAGALAAEFQFSREDADRIARAAITATDPDKRLREALEECAIAADVDWACTAIQKLHEHKARFRLEQRLLKIDAALSHNGG
jgi:hypothetical protein